MVILVIHRRVDLPHVTDLLKDAGLIDVRWLTQYARDRGTAVHLAASLLVRDDLDEESVTEDVNVYLRGFRRFLRDVKPEIIGTEIPVENKELGYCGTTDLLLRIHGRKGALDEKCGAPECWHQLQLAGYTGCFDEPLARWNLYLRPDGTYSLVEHKSRSDWPVFKAILLLAQWRKVNG
jgi:hypothetical protein